ncbi:hypothetical protein [Paenibacillus illinoisensis]|uniref:hypothetical protein n=2 Tax=Paenibacillus illinoisensis TaxID=59845 RepID=UPI00301BB48C
MRKDREMDLATIIDSKDKIFEWFALIFIFVFGVLLFVWGIYSFVSFFRQIFKLFKPVKGKMFDCLSCGSYISNEAHHCPHCGHHYGQKYPTPLAILMLFLFGGMGIGLGTYAFLAVLDLYMEL